MISDPMNIVFAIVLACIVQYGREIEISDGGHGLGCSNCAGGDCQLPPKGSDCNTGYYAGRCE